MELKKDFISIVMPVYNAQKYLEDTIASVQNQTFEDWELICVDDGSTDRSMEILKKYKDARIHLYQNEKNSGPAFTRNHGLEKASGQYLAYLDADDLWDVDKLEKQFGFMKRTGCAFSFTGYEFAGEDGVRNGTVVHVPSVVDYRYALKHTVISTITVMFDRMQIADDVLHMPLDARGEDTATWWKILRQGYQAYGMDEALSVYRRYAGSRSANKLDAVYGTWKMYRRCEHLPLIQSAYYFCNYILNAVKRRL